MLKKNLRTENSEMQGSPDAKKPCKGILKTSSSFDKHSGASHRKSAKFDELNVLQTYHPPDKDYGHMKIEEPKTPYNYDIDPNAIPTDQLDAELLAEKLTVAANTRTSSYDETDSSDEEFDETDEDKSRRFQFEKRRKAHYNEFEAVRLARKLIEEEDDEDDDDNDDDKDTNTNDGNNTKKSDDEHNNTNDNNPSGSGTRSDKKK